MQKRKYESKKLLKEIPTEEQMSNVLFGLYSSQDHVVAMTGPAYLDHALELLLDAKFRPLNTTDWERLFDGAQGGLLGPTSAKIRMAYALQLITDDTYHDLLLINEVRNVFGHTLHPCDFSNAEIAADCAKLKLTSHMQFAILLGVDSGTAKGKFTFAVLILYTELMQRLKPLLKAKILLEKEPWRAMLPTSPETPTPPSQDKDPPETDSKEP